MTAPAPEIALTPGDLLTLHQPDTGGSCTGCRANCQGCTAPHPWPCTVALCLTAVRPERIVVAEALEWAAAQAMGEARWNEITQRQTWAAARMRRLARLFRARAHQLLQGL